MGHLIKYVGHVVCLWAFTNSCHLLFGCFLLFKVCSRFQFSLSGPENVLTGTFSFFIESNFFFWLHLVYNAYLENYLLAQWLLCSWTWSGTSSQRSRHTDQDIESFEKITKQWTWEEVHSGGEVLDWWSPVLLWRRWRKSRRSRDIAPLPCFKVHYHDLHHDHRHNHHQDHRHAQQHVLHHDHHHPHDHWLHLCAQASSGLFSSTSTSSSRTTHKRPSSVRTFLTSGSF